MTTSRGVVGLAAGLACAALAGCGGGGLSAPRTEPVSGTVLLKGKPAAGVRVTFHPRFDMGAVKFTPSGLTNKEGRFTLCTAAADDGAPRGDYAVTFELMQGGADKMGRDIEVDAWKGKYGDPDKSPWKVTVQKGDNTVGPFDLDDCWMPRRKQRVGQRRRAHRLGLSLGQGGAIGAQRHRWTGDGEQEEGERREHRFTLLPSGQAPKVRCHQPRRGAGVPSSVASVAAASS